MSSPVVCARMKAGLLLQFSDVFVLGTSMVAILLGFGGGVGLLFISFSEIVKVFLKVTSKFATK